MALVSKTTCSPGDLRDVDSVLALPSPGEKETAICSSMLAWEIHGQRAGGLHFMRLQRVDMQPSVHTLESQ